MLHATMLYSLHQMLQYEYNIAYSIAGSGSGHGDPAHVHRAVFIFFICETSVAPAAASD